MGPGSRADSISSLEITDVHRIGGKGSGARMRNPSLMADSFRPHGWRYPVGISWRSMAAAVSLGIRQKEITSWPFSRTWVRQYSRKLSKMI